MIDTNQVPRMPIRERLDRLRAYEGTYRSDELSYRPMLASTPEEFEVWWNTTGGTVPYTAKEILQKWRPPSVSRGVPESTWSFGPDAVDTEAVDWISVDMAQDLIPTV